MNQDPLFRRRSFLAVFVLGLPLLIAPGCKEELPSPWKEMHFPLSNSQIPPGADATRFRIMYRNTRQLEAYFQEFRSALERAGYTYVEEAPNHDPASETSAAFFEKEGKKLRLTVNTDAHTHVEVKLEP